MKNILTITIIFVTTLSAVCNADQSQKTDNEDMPYFKNLVFGDAKFNIDLGYTNNIGAKDKTGLNVPIKVNEDIEEYEVSVGYSDKPIIRDFWFYFKKDKAINRYKELKAANSPVISGFFDAVTFYAKIGYGKTLQNSAISNEFTETHNTNYSIGINYEVP